MSQLTPIGLVKILGQVTVILAVPMIGGALAGIFLDQFFQTTPTLFLASFGIGNLIAIAGILLFIRAGQRKLRRTEPGPNGTTRYDGA